MAKHIDYAFKSHVIREHSDLLLKAKQSSYLDYCIHEFRENGVLMPNIERYNGVLTKNELFTECLENGLNKELLEAYKINEAYWKRLRRLKQRVNEMLTSGPCLFLTLTFTDETLQNTTEKKRRVAVSRYLKQFNCKYIANIDFGAENHREHYHAVIQCKSVDTTSWHKYGAIYIEKVRNNGIKRNSERLSKYVCKLSNHAIKETTRRSSLLYSR